MPLPVPPTEPRSPELLRQHYDAEKALARLLREASAEERRELYREVYDAYFRLSGLPETDPEGQRHVVALQVKTLEPFLRPETVFMELGSGDGALARAIAERVRKVFAVEASTEATCGVDWPPNADLVVADASRLGLDDGTVDLAYSCHFIEHLHPDDALDHAVEVRRVLVPGGRYMVVTPNRLWGPHDISRYFDDEPTGFHLREYTHTELAALLRRAGFRRTAALRGIGRVPSLRAIWPYRTIEGALDLLPSPFRRGLMVLADRLWKAPFRPLEQVIVVGML